MSRYGDYVLCLSITLNASMMIAYAWQGFYAQAVYWFGALLINCSLLGMK